MKFAKRNTYIYLSYYLGNWGDENYCYLCKNYINVNNKLVSLTIKIYQTIIMKYDKKNQIYR